MAKKPSNNNGNNNGKQLSTGLFLPVAKVFSSEQEVQEAQSTRDTAKATRDFTNKGLRYMLSQANHVVKTHKAVNNAHKFLMKFGLMAQASDASLSVAQRKTDLMGEAIEHKAGVQITAAESRHAQLLGAISSKYASVKGTAEAKSLPWGE